MTDGTPAEPLSLAAAARRVVADASTLVRTEAALARMETEANLAAAGAAAGRIGLGLFLLLLALLFVILAGLTWLASAIGWLGALLAVAGVAGLGGAILYASGRAAARDVRILPERTLGRMNADLKALSAMAPPGPEAGPVPAPEPASGQG
jgi:hypothetical protein